MVDIELHNKNVKYHDITINIMMFSMKFMRGKKFLYHGILSILHGTYTNITIVTIP